MSNRGHPLWLVLRDPVVGPMVESNHDEERLARIERMLEELQRESADEKVRAANRAILTVTTTVVESSAASRDKSTKRSSRVKGYRA